MLSKPTWKKPPKKSISDKAKNLTVDVLDILLGIPEALISGVDRPSAYSAITTCSDHVMTVSNICNFFNSLRRRGYIEVVQENGKESVRFTNKTRIKLIDRLSEKLGRDDKLRFVSFDIPERMAAQRTLFRRAIKRIGFKQIQQSLWVSDRNIGELVDLVSIEYDVKDYVIYIVSESTDAEQQIRAIINSTNTDLARPLQNSVSPIKLSGIN